MWASFELDVFYCLSLDDFVLIIAPDVSPATMSNFFRGYMYTVVNFTTSTNDGVSVTGYMRETTNVKDVLGIASLQYLVVWKNYYGYAKNLLGNSC